MPASSSTPTKKTKSPKKGGAAAAAAAASAASTSTSTSTSTSSSSPLPLIDGNVSTAQTLKALKALRAHRQKHRESLAAKSSDAGKSLLPLDGGDDDGEGGQREEMVWVNVTVKRLGVERKVKPVMVVCLFVKDPQRTYKDLLPTLGVSCVDRIVGVSKLKGKFAPYEARRSLLDAHDVFLADDRVSALLPALLGTKWLAKKSKVPLPVNVTRTRHIKAELDKAVGATHFTPATRGSCVSVPVGSLAHYSPEEVIQNIQVVIPRVVAKLPYDGWANVQNIEIKLPKSASLPIWNCDLSTRWEGVPTLGADEGEGENKAQQSRAATTTTTTTAPTAAKTKKTKSSLQADATAPTPEKKKKKKKVSASAAQGSSDRAQVKAVKAAGVKPARSGSTAKA